jgi:Pyruvate/2-oxoacid:ferredoxin oxidoreductase delta subunit
MSKTTGPIPIIECRENIACNPCELVCASGAITVGSPITNLPRLHPERCAGCGECVAGCPGLAIFLWEAGENGGRDAITLPYEMRPLPRKGEIVLATDGDGEVVAEAEVLRVDARPGYNRTAVVTLSVPAPAGARVRSLRPAGVVRPVGPAGGRAGEGRPRP